MTNEMKYLMYLYACAAGSVSAEPAQYSVDYETLYALADKMSLLSMLSYALKISPQVPCPPQIKERLYSAMLGTALKNQMRTDAVLKVLQDIENAGIRAIVLKGLDCARFYAKPECRICADTDLLIDPKDEQRLLAYFEENGYTVHRRKKHQHHSECFDSQAGLFEVHTKIWEDFISDAMLKRVRMIKNCTARSVLAAVNSTQIRVLQPTDAMIFMTLHLVKHFMFHYASVKMCYDLALYYVRNKAGVDVKKYRSWVKKLGYETVVSAVFSAMVLYCGFKKEDFDSIADFNLKNAQRFAETLAQFDSHNDDHDPDPSVMLQYCTTNSNLRVRGRIYTFFFNARQVAATKAMLIFPPKVHLEQAYPYLRKHPYFYPVACVHRFLTRGTKHILHSAPEHGSILHHRENLHRRITEAENQRINMLRDMDLL